MRNWLNLKKMIKLDEHMIISLFEYGQKMKAFKFDQIKPIYV